MERPDLANRALLGLLLLCNIFSVYKVMCLQHLPRGKEYEVVYPQKLYARHRRNSENSTAIFPDEVKYGFKLQGQDIVMHLERNQYLFDKNYTETHYSLSGQPETTTPNILDHCYYHGYIGNKSDSEVSISICDGLRGYFKTNGQQYLIEPLRLMEHEEHAVYKDEDQKNGYLHCGVKDTTWIRTRPYVYHSSDKAREAMLNKRKYIKTVLVADNRLYLKYGKNAEKIRKRFFTMLNRVNMIYKTINIYVGLIGLEIWDKKDPIEVTSDPGELLARFCSWRQNVLLKRIKNDNANLVTGIGFSTSTVGYANVAVMCQDEYSCTVNMDFGGENTAAAVVAHEMGHNLGMKHDEDGCSCPGPMCVMVTSLGAWQEPTHFSSCSLDQLKGFLSASMPMCLLVRPIVKDLKAPPVCQNGFPEATEDCDCGKKEECKDPCCVPETCKFKPPSQCTEGACCEKCMYKPRGTICRPSKDECDIPERCSGKGFGCQMDRFNSNGIPCQQNTGYCFNGVCPNLVAQCIDIFGNGSTVVDSCFRHNKKGVNYGHCKYSKGKYIACLPKDEMCGHIWCAGGDKNPYYGTAVIGFSSCKTFVSAGDFVEGVGMIAQGTKCGDGKVCYNYECNTVKQAYKVEECLKRCTGQGKCDHQNLCSCEPGWAGPDCKVARASSLDNTSAKILLAAYIISIPVVVIRDFYQQKLQVYKLHS